ncbi:MAG: DUF1800 family protein [Pseudomonadota bacterium]
MPGDPGGGASPAPAPPSGGAFDGVFTDANETARFLTQATFGPTPTDLVELPGSSASDWFRNELSKDITPHLNKIGEPEIRGASTMFWRTAVEADDQLRQRMVYALSQLLVVSDFGGEVLTDIPEAVGYYQDVLAQHAFGTYRELLEAVTYAPAMGYYLTYLGNERGDAATGRMPDENYAREILQLFSIGVLQLNPDGTPTLDVDGEPIELYDNADITGLARVFTGIDFTEATVFDPDDPGALEWTTPMTMYEAPHSPLEKRFLGLTIPAGTDGVTSLELALDHIAAHPNLAPFVSRQLIQRFVTSHPEPDYVARVATTFDAGTFELPDGAPVGSGRRGDLGATLAAILFDREARDSDARRAVGFGKLREPALRVTAWARACGVGNPSPEYVTPLIIAYDTSMLGQKPFAATSVFNFYRPGYVAPGTLSGSAGRTAPELQILNATSAFGYANVMTFLIFGGVRDDEYQQELRDEVFDLGGDEPLEFDADAAATAFLPNYDELETLASDPERMIDRLDALFTFGGLSVETRARILAVTNAVPAEFAELRVQRAILLLMTSVDFLVQK